MDTESISTEKAHASVGEWRRTEKPEGIKKGLRLVTQD